MVISEKSGNLRGGERGGGIKRIFSPSNLYVFALLVYLKNKVT